MKFTTIKLSSLGLPDRVSAREMQKRQANFEELYDSKTLFYDVFFFSEQLFFIGPRISDVALPKVLDAISIDGRKLSELDIEIRLSKKVSKIILKCSSDCSVKVLSSSIFPELRACDFSDKNVLYTLQKNNRLEWISDWVAINRERHKLDHVIIYDNNSSLYSIADLNDRLTRDFGADFCVVYGAPFIYGPGAFNGSSWDSDYLQYAMFEHVRHSFFSKSGRILNSDIDEIFTGNDVFSCLSETGAPACTFGGKWVYVRDTKRDDRDFYRHRDHEVVDIDSGCPKKWVCDLSLISDDAWLNVHGLGNQKNVVDLHDYYAHFSGISDGWKYKRNVFKPGLLNSVYISW